MVAWRPAQPPRQPATVRASSQGETRRSGRVTRSGYCRTPGAASDGAENLRHGPARGPAARLSAWRGPRQPRPAKAMRHISLTDGLAGPCRPIPADTLADLTVVSIDGLTIARTARNDRCAPPIADGAQIRGPLGPEDPGEFGLVCFAESDKNVLEAFGGSLRSAGS